MAIKRIDTGTITATDTTATGTIGHIQGQILKVEIIASASSDFWLFVDASDEDESVVDEDIVGVTGTKITVNTTLIVYPVVAQKVGSTAAVTDPDQYISPIVSGSLEYSVASIAAADTFRIVVWYQPHSDNTG